MSRKPRLSLSNSPERCSASRKSVPPTCLTVFGELAGGKTRCSSAGSMRQRPESSFSAETLSFEIASEIVDLLFPVAFGACPKCVHEAFYIVLSNTSKGIRENGLHQFTLSRLARSRCCCPRRLQKSIQWPVGCPENGRFSSGLRRTWCGINSKRTVLLCCDFQKLVLAISGSRYCFFNVRVRRQQGRPEK